MVYLFFSQILFLFLTSCVYVFISSWNDKHILSFASSKKKNICAIWRKVKSENRRHKNYFVNAKNSCDFFFIAFIYVFILKRGQKYNYIIGKYIKVTEQMRTADHVTAKRTSLNSVSKSLWMSHRVMCYLWHGTKTVFEKLRKTGGGYDTMLQSKTRPVSYTPASTPPPRIHRFAYKLLFFSFFFNYKSWKLTANMGNGLKTFSWSLFCSIKNKKRTKIWRRKADDNRGKTSLNGMSVQVLGQGSPTRGRHPVNGTHSVRGSDAAYCFAGYGEPFS